MMTPTTAQTSTPSVANSQDIHMSPRIMGLPIRSFATSPGASLTKPGESHACQGAKRIQHAGPVSVSDGHRPGEEEGHPHGEYLAHSPGPLNARPWRLQRQGYLSTRSGLRISKVNAISRLRATSQ